MIRAVAANGANRAARRPFPLRQTLHPMKTRFLSAAFAAMLVPAAATAEETIEQSLPGLWQVCNGDILTVRRELGPVMGFCGGERNSNATYVSPIDGSTNRWTENDSWVYDGMMFMEAGTNYTFASLIDDYATITIDGNPVLSQVGCTFTSASHMCTSSGWHRIVIRVWDTGGGYGNNRDFTPGIAYNTTGQTLQQPVSGWSQLVDPGDGSLLRTSYADPEKNCLPGFRFATFSGSAYDGSSSIWDYATKRCVYPSQLYRFRGTAPAMPEQTTYGYAAYMFMEEGVVYTFNAKYDDFSFVKIDSTTVISKQRSECSEASGTFTPSFTGWHRLEIRVSNNGGDGGLIDGIGVRYRKGSDSSWSVLSDGGSGNLFRVGHPDYPALTGAPELEEMPLEDVYPVVVSSSMRENDPTIMDITYIVYSNPETTPTVNVRALAFENGECGFATVVRPETWVEGTEINLGDGIAANVEHHLAWRVSTDWKTDLAKVKFEILAMKPDAQLLPLHFVTIPAAEGHPKTVVSVDNLSAPAYEISRDSSSHFGIYQQWWGSGLSPRVVGHDVLLHALLWLYADKDAGLSLDNGILKSGTVLLVRHAAFLQNSCYDGVNDNPRSSGHWSLNPNAIRYVFGKMGFRLLENADELAWINENTRLNLQPQQFRQYAVKTVEE